MAQHSGRKLANYIMEPFFAIGTPIRVLQILQYPRGSWSVDTELVCTNYNTYNEVQPIVTAGTAVRQMTVRMTVNVGGTLFDTLC